MTNLDNFKEVVNRRSDDLIELTIDSMKIGVPFEECFPVIQWTSFEEDGKVYRLKISYEIREND